MGKFFDNLWYWVIDTVTFGYFTRKKLKVANEALDKADEVLKNPPVEYTQLKVFDPDSPSFWNQIHAIAQLDELKFMFELLRDKHMNERILDPRAIDGGHSEKLVSMLYGIQMVEDELKAYSEKWIEINKEVPVVSDE